MPNEIRIISLDFFRKSSEYSVSDDIDANYISFAYPGMFIGVGETREEAMSMAKMRLKASRKSYLENHKEDPNWNSWALDRESKIRSLLSKTGLKKNHVWNEEDLAKK